ncbi:hypothetical protein [Selenomonas sp. FC4001]|uniref:hypothetical protein n=1 Tax=Selenomonas sp. FC4001 TaxID=1408313 RepID=UPI00055D0717|nr:hypothetical protein [Selenomonas sp. FC4001]
MFEFDDNIPVRKLQVVSIGKTSAKLKKHLRNTTLTLHDSPHEGTQWTDIDVIFLVADASEEHDLEKFKEIVKISKQQNIMLFPLLISYEPIEINNSIIIVNPLYFPSEEKLYTYIVESIKSIETFNSKTGIVDIGLEDIKALLSPPSRLAFSYEEQNTTTDKSVIAKMALQKLYDMNIPAHSGKFIVLNIIGSEDNISMFEIQEICELVSEEIGYNESCVLWGANIDNELDEKIHISIWVKL